MESCDLPALPADRQDMARLQWESVRDVAVILLKWLIIGNVVLTLAILIKVFLTY